MVVLIVESVPVGLRGQLSKWMLEPKAGVFVGTVSAAVRELLWEKACEEIASGGVTLIYRTDNEQGFAIRSFGETTRQVEEWEGLFLVRRPNPRPLGEPEEELVTEPDWATMLYASIWAKTSRGVELNEGEPPWHPLIAHMIDVAWVARRIWQYLLPAAVRQHVTTAMGLTSVDQAGSWIAFFAGLHDLGKASPDFELRAAPTLERLRAEGFKPADRPGAPAHGFITTYLLGQLLPDLGIQADSAYAIGFAVGGHHGTFPHPGQFRDIRRQVGGGRWTEATRNLMLTLAHALGVDRLPAPPGDLSNASATLVTLAGLTSVSDWIGSNHDYFPFVGDEINLPRYPRRARWLALKALLRLGWFHRPAKVEALPFEELFDLTPNPLQSAMIGLGEELTEPSLLLVEYPMGGGKTEGALYLANCLHAQAGQQGFYLALPTMATSNQMFARASRYLENRFPGQSLNVQLMHGHADLHAEFAAMRREGDQLPTPPVTGDEEGEERKRSKARLLAAEWFTYRKRGLLAPYGIGTIDQTLMGALQTRHYFVRLFGLAGKVVIFDEVHAYDTYMQELLSMLLTWLGALGSSVILLSATLPRATRERLLEAYSSGRGLGRIPPAEAKPYPRLTWVSEKGRGEIELPAPASRTLTLNFVDPAADWMSDLVARVGQGGCAAVLCNTVGRAQEVYRAFKGMKPDCELLLFHARFPFDDRQRLEQEVLTRFGKGAVDRPHKAICVATQVIEQSLDLDFDLMVSELAPVDLLLQRSGRIWRHQRRDRPVQFHGPELWMIRPSFSVDGLPDFPPAKFAVYDPHLLLRTWLTLKDRDQVTIPGDMEPLLEAVYDSRQPPEEIAPALATYWQKTAKTLMHGEGDQMREAQRRIIPPVSATFTDQVSESLEEEDEGVHSALRMMTRLGGLSVEIVCLYEREGLYWTLPTGGEQVRMDHRPDRDGTRSLLGRSLRMSFRTDLVKAILQTPVPDTWEATAYLRRHRLLVFAPDGTCLSSGLPLHLDPDLGLVYVPGEKEASR